MYYTRYLDILLTSFTVLIATSTGVVLAAPPIASEWLTATNGDWTDASKWSTPNFPDFNLPNSGDTYDVAIGVGGSPYTVSLDDHVRINTLSLDSSDVELDIDLAVLSVDQGLSLNGSTISLSSTDSLLTSADIVFSSKDSSEQFIAGNGLIRFLEGRDNNINGPSQGALTIDSGIMIESLARQGKIRSFGGPLTNLGTLRSSPGGTLEIRGETFVNKALVEIGGRTEIRSDTWRNEGTLNIKPGGRLTLFGNFVADDIGIVIDEGASEVVLAGVLDNTGQVLDLDHLGLTVPLRLNGGEIRGGVITSSGSGSLGFFGGIHAIFNGVTLATDVELEGGNGTPRVFVTNGLTLDESTITMPEGAELLFSGSDPQTLGGSGTVFAPNRPLTSAVTTIAGSQLTIGENITIRNGTEAFRELEIDFFENRGTIIAEAPDSVVSIGDNINLSTGPTWTNHGVIRVLSGTLEFWGNYSVDDIGTLDFVGGEVVLQGNVLNEGKTITQDASTGGWKFRGTVHGGRIETDDGIIADVAGTFDDVTLAGEAVLFDDFDSTALGALRVPNSLSFDHGTLTIEPFAELSINQIVALSGNGQIFLNGTPENSRIQTFTGGEVTIGPNVFVRTGPTGGGAISRSSLPVINQGTISAETAGQTLVIDGAFQNMGTLQSLNGSTLRINADNWINEGTIHLMEGKILINSDSFENGASGIVTGSGEIELNASHFVNSGTISPGLSTGHLSIDGVLDLQSTSSLAMEIGGTLEGEFDTISVAVDSVLDGHLSVSLIDDFRLGFDQHFTILDADGSLTGEFIGLSEGSSVGNFGGLELFVTYDMGIDNDVTLFTSAPNLPELRLVIGDMVDDGTLNQGQGNSLLEKLDFNSNQQATLNRFGAFINQINAFVNANILTLMESQLLIDAAESLRDASLSLEDNFNLNGGMDGTDFLKWQRGETPNPLSSTDLAVWEDNFGTITLHSAVLVAIPEPSTGILLVLGIAAMFACRGIQESKLYCT